MTQCQLRSAHKSMCCCDKDPIRVARLTLRACAQPLNLGSSEMVSMNGMMEMAMGFEEKNLPIKHIPGPEVPMPMTLLCYSGARLSSMRLQS